MLSMKRETAAASLFCGNCPHMRPAEIVEPVPVHRNAGANVRKVYLDHCVNSGLANVANARWQDIGVGKVLAQAIAAGTAEVWTTPTEVVETLLWADFDEHGQVIESEKLDLRMKCARSTLEMIEATRMAPSFEFVVVDNFLTALEMIAPGVVENRHYFELEQKQNQQVYLGLLAILAAYRPLDRPAAIEDLLRVKLTTRLLHSRFLLDPVKFVADLVATAAEFRVTSEDIFAEFDSRSLSDIRDEIEANLAAKKAITPVARNRLMKNKASIAQSYGAAELGECLGVVFQDPIRMMLTFNIRAMKQHWQVLTDVAGQPPIPFPGPAEDEACVDDPTLSANALSLLFRRFARFKLLVPQISPLVALGEIEMCLNQNELPKGSGLAFDCQHAAMLTRTNILVTHDERLANLAKRAIKVIADADATHEIVVVRNAGELANALEKPVAP